MSSVLVVGLMVGACRNGNGNTGDAGSDSGLSNGGRDGGGGTTPDGAGGETPQVCDVARQQGCAADELCLRGLLEGGGQGNRCFPGECDLVAQNCPAGNKCTYVRQGSETTRRCVPDGTVTEGGACESTTQPGGDIFYDTCKAGLYCTDQTGPDGGTTFTCQKFCYGNEQCTAPRACVEVLRFTGSDELPRVCGEAGSGCDPLAQGCASSLGCYPTPGSGAVCVTAGTVEDGSPCAYSNDCKPGSACVKDGAGLVCRKLCRAPSGEPGCASGRCEPLQDFAGVGACVR
ncbi:hypothetical protein JQX13_35645 [Archangium violaceum]|uniref:hypothetical protein n=1 Tax=Archangium violaceum TaxID=83451 RepID=UPI00193BDD82|nr:hypothetical protein [Archangium violaceum]QRK05470.1 hypothetical protein JQX13_35645 [Archangium violaceum]